MNVTKVLSLAIWWMATAALGASTAHAKDRAAQWCEQQWQIDSAEATSRDIPDFPRLLDKWKSHEKRCSGTVAYEARLAIAYLYANERQKAREVLKALSGLVSDYSHLVELVSLEVEYADPTALVDERRLRELEREYLAYVSKYPAFPDGFALLGGLQTMLGKHQEAIKSLESGLKSSTGAWGVYRNLTISYTAVGRYAEAMQAADKAIDLNDSLTSDPLFMYAGAKTNAALGDVRAAQVTLRVIAAKKPEVRRDPEFREAVEFVKSRMSK